MKQIKTRLYIISMSHTNQSLQGNINPFTF